MDVFKLIVCGRIVAHCNNRESASDFAKHYSDKLTMMSVEVWEKYGEDYRFDRTFTDGKLTEISLRSLQA